MKKYSILLAITALIIASLACQTIMGGGPGDIPEIPQTDGGDTTNPSDSVDPGNITVGGESSFAVPSDAFNVFNAPDTVTFQTNLSGEEVVKFYQEEFGKMGYTEDASLTTSFSGIFTMGFNGHESGKQIFIAGAPVGDGSTTVTITLQ